MAKVSPEVAALQADLTKWRRHLHTHPETGFEEFATTEFIVETLSGMGIAASRPGPTGAVADIVGGRPGPTIAVRADIDALPVQEENDIAYRSVNAGRMHACGHDGHTAILLGLAKILQSEKDELPGRVRLIFQPAEEKPPGGAQAMIKAGALEGVAHVIGLHLWSELPTGTAGIAPGPLMANADEFTATIVGRGGHGSAPHQTVDSIVLASQYVTALQTVVSRRVDPLQPAVVSVGTIHGGFTFNVIAPETTVTGTVRSFDAATRDLIEKEMERILKGICSQAGAEYRFEFRRGYPAVVNDPAVTDLFKRAAQAVLGNDAVVHHPPVMGGEDFAYYGQVVPSAFLFLGARNPDKGASYPHHHPRFNIDEDALPIGVEVFRRAVYDLLSERT